MTKFKKNIFIIATFLVIICLCLAVYFYINPAEQNINKTVAAETYLKDINSFVLTGKTNEEYQKKFKYNINKDLFAIGEDSYQRQKPSEDIIEEYKLENYTLENDKLANNLEKAIKDNFQINILKSSKNYNLFLIKINYKTFYYFDYISDLKTLENELLSRLNLISENDSSPETVANKYKAKVKSMQILDKYLTDYINQDEQKSYDLYLFSGKSSNNTQEVEAYLYQILGYHYDKFKNNFEQRIAKYTKNIDDEKVLEL